MEIVSLLPNSVRLKGKSASLVINPQGKDINYTGMVIFYTDKKNLKFNPNTVVINGAGDYEIAGIKLSGIRYENDILYSFLIDNVSILLVETKAMVKNHQKLRDYDIVLVYMQNGEYVSSAVNSASSAVLYFGEKASETVKKTVKEGLQEMNKYSVTKDKLPTEVVQILLV